MIDKEIIESYVKSRAKIVADFKASLKKDDDDFKDKLLKSCPITIGQIYERTVTRKTYMGEKTETSKWKVTSLSPNVLVLQELRLNSMVNLVKENCICLLLLLELILLLMIIINL